MLLRKAFGCVEGVTVATVNCSAQTTTQDIIRKLFSACSLKTKSQGRVCMPTSGKRLILYLRDVNLPIPDKYDTMQLIAFLQQLITHQVRWLTCATFVILIRW